MLLDHTGSRQLDTNSEHFTDKEWRGEKHLMHPEIISTVNGTRRYLGYPVSFSPSNGALARKAGKSTSKHNVDRWGLSLAVDGYGSRLEPLRWMKAAKAAGATGFGIYADMRYHVRIDGVRKLVNWVGFHIDVRPNVPRGKIVLFGRRYNPETGRHDVEIGYKPCMQLIQKRIERGDFYGKEPTRR